jgi:IS5 family transposase
MNEGTCIIVDATIIGAPSSTKNADKQRDPEMHQVEPIHLLTRTEN